jgi:MoaA/NifB/PqqE/SkfB family radical SAM enzyme
MGISDKSRMMAAAGRLPLPLASAADTFCIYPWVHLRLHADGTSIVCCKFRGAVQDGGRPMNIQTDSLEVIWNSDMMRQLRRDMLFGQKVPGCVECYQEEKASGVSMRQSGNKAWQTGRFLNDERQTLETLAARTVTDDYRQPGAAPASFELNVGNLCNLKCRMCNGGASSRIRRDPVHNRWSGTWDPGLGKTDGTDTPPMPDGPPGENWLRKAELVRDQLLRYPDQLKRLYFLGGETLLIKEVGDILQSLIDAGVSRNVSISLVTNGTTTHCPWLRLTEQFRDLNITLSIDGYGPYYDYIRYPAKWETVARNLPVLRTLPRATMHGAVTLQNYNALNVVDLFRYFDAIELDFYAYPVSLPRWLRPTNMPPTARRLAAERLRRYADHDCRPQHQGLVRGLAAGFEAAGDQFDPRLLWEFMLFTNDLDVTRGQQFRTTHAEMHALIVEAGFAWHDETRYAQRVNLPLATTAVG